MAPRFATGWRRFVPFIGYHHVLMILIAIAIILLCKSNHEMDHTIPTKLT